MSRALYKARIAATLLSRGQRTALLTDHVSTGGVFLRTDSPPEAMVLLRIEFVLPPSSARVVLHGMVTELVPQRREDSAPGAEIAFFAKTGEASDRWDEFIWYVARSFPSATSHPVLLALGATDQTRRAHPRVVSASIIPAESQSPPGSFTVGDISEGGMAPGAARMMGTLPGPGYSDGSAWIVPAEDSWG